MPNHVTHRIIIEGAKTDIDLFEKTFITEHKDERNVWNCFDFNTIIPMPEILRGTESSSAVAIGLAYLDIHIPNPGAFLSHSGLKEYLKYSWVKDLKITTVGELKKYIETERPRDIELAKTAKKAFDETGHTDWYGWSNENWNTKWNSYSFSMERQSDDCLEMKFDTAWSVPVPVFEELAKRTEVANLVIKIVAFDEGWNFAFVGGIVEGVFRGERLKATDKLYEDVYGEAPEHEDEEESESESSTPLIGAV